MITSRFTSTKFVKVSRLLKICVSFANDRTKTVSLFEIIISK